MDANEVKELLEGNMYEEEVKAVIFEAKQLGVKGVTFFLFDRKYAISVHKRNKRF